MSGGNVKKVGYGVEDVPAPHLCVLFGLQQAIVCIGGSLSVPFILTPLICTNEDESDDVKAKLLSITMFMCGIATVLQVMVGIRLPVVQGGSHTFIPPIIAMMTLEQFRCTSQGEKGDWKLRMREIQGNLMLASVTQVVVGCTGLIGFIMRFIGPLTISPTIALIGLSLTEVVADFCQYQWGISILTLALILLFAVFINKINVPLPAFNLKEKCHITRFPLFQLLPLVLAISLSWLLCFVLTETEVFSSNSTDLDYFARTDIRLDVVDGAPWFDFPGPLPFGMPTVSAAGYVGMLAATISSIIESVGDYCAAARLSDAPPPPPHAVNRGIAMEGIASIISGLVGAGHATTTYSNNIGIIGITKVASRAVFCVAGIILILCGVVGKFGAVLSLIPEPVVGGSLIVGFGFVVAVGISVLQFCDLSSMRNLTIIGTSYIVGLAIPRWLQKHPAMVNTGSPELDQTISVLFGTASFTGGIIAFILDNTVPGTIEERGIRKWQEPKESEEASSMDVDYKTYEFPFVTDFLRRRSCCHYIPVSPVFDKEIICPCLHKKHTSKYVFEQEVATELGETKSDDNNVRVHNVDE